MKRLTTIALALLLALASAWALNAQDLTGDEILARASEQGTLTAEGSRINRVSFDILSKDGSTLSREFAFFGKQEDGEPDKLLIYFLAPELERGTIFLSLDPVDPVEDTRLWLLLSALGQVKELVSENDRNAGFAGSNLQNDQIGGGLDFSDDYAGELLGEEELTVTWLGEAQTRTAYQVALTAKPEADVDFPSGTVWIDTEAFVVLRGELINKADQLEQVSTADDFIAFDGSIEPNVLVVENVLEDSRTTISISDRRTVDELPDDIFTPEALPEFDPADFGVEG